MKKRETGENFLVLGIMYIVALVRSRRVKQPKTVIMANFASAAADGMRGQIVGGARMWARLRPRGKRAANLDLNMGERETWQPQMEMVRHCIQMHIMRIEVEWIRPAGLGISVCGYRLRGWSSP